MEKTLEEIIKQLESQGNKINYRKRKDGGYIITEIDGVKYTGAEGNKQARHMTGSSLSQARYEQLNRIKPPAGMNPSKRKKAPIDAEVKKKLQRVQRIWRKQETEANIGRITTPKIRWIIEHKGKDVAIEALNKAEAYSRGYAYSDNVMHLIERLNRSMYGLEDSEREKIKEIIQYIETNASTFKEKWIWPIYRLTYMMEQGTLSVDEYCRQVMNIMR